MRFVPYFPTPLATAHLKGPHVDFAGLSPLLALLGGAVIVLLVGLLGSRWVRERVVPTLSLVALGAAAGLTIWQWHAQKSIVSGALRIDDLSLALNLILVAGGAAAVLLAWRSLAAHEAAHGEFHALLLTSIGGMSLLAAAQNTVVVFLGLELLSIPLYVLCATEMRREHSLESGLKYLIIGSVGSATLLYGVALIYGATGATDFNAIAAAISSDGLSGNVLLLTGIALCVAGLCFKASVAPFHQWTPDVYEGAPTPITAFMAVATKVAALGVFLRFFDVALVEAQQSWGPALATLAAITIIVGNVGALGQSSLKRMLAYSAVGQAGYMLAGVVVATQLGIRATVFYLAVYLFMNMAAFAVIVARERETDLGDSVSALAGPRPRAALPGVADDAGDARPRRHPGDGGLHGQVLLDRCRRRRRLHVAGGRDRDRLDDLARLLPAGDRLDVDASGTRCPHAAAGGSSACTGRRPAARDRRRLAGARRGDGHSEDSPPTGGRSRRGPRGRSDALLRDRPAAAVRPRAARRPRFRTPLSTPRSAACGRAAWWVACGVCRSRAVVVGRVRRDVACRRR